MSNWPSTCARRVLAALQRIGWSVDQQPICDGFGAPDAQGHTLQGELMFDHVKFGVSDYATSKAFFLKALEPLGVTDSKEWPPNGIEMGAPGGSASLCLYQTKEKPAHLHFAFAAKNRQQVAAFYRAALEAGAE